MSTCEPPIAGFPPHLWAWLRENLDVRPHVVARARARLEAGSQPAAEDVALAMLRGASSP